MSAASLEELTEQVRRAVGLRLFTVLAWDAEREVLRRVHTTHPAEYPVGGEKSVEVAQGWLRTCIVDQQPFLGPTAADVREVFADHEVIAGLGCGAIVNAPVLRDGRTVAVVNVLDAEGAYDEASMTAVQALVADAGHLVIDADGSAR